MSEPSGSARDVGSNQAGGVSASNRAPGRRPSRRAVVLAALAVAALVLAVTSLTWASGSAPTPVGTEDVAVRGTTAAPVVAAAALVVGAAALAVAIGRRVAATVGGAVLVAAGALVVGGAVTFLGNPQEPVLSAAADVSGVRELAGPVAVGPWPWVAAGLGLAAAASGVAAVLSARGWQSTGRRFERASEASRATDARTRAMDDWDALGRGEDPTER